jgi:hypothetical protein
MMKSKRISLHINNLVALHNSVFHSFENKKKKFYSENQFNEKPSSQTVYAIVSSCFIFLPAEVELHHTAVNTDSKLFALESYV